MVHSDSMSPTPPGIWSKLSRRWELNTSLAEGSARRSQQTLTMHLGLPSLSGILLFQQIQLTTRYPDCPHCCWKESLTVQISALQSHTLCSVCVAVIMPSSQQSGILALTTPCLRCYNYKKGGREKYQQMDVSFEAQSKSLATLSAFSYIPPRRNEPREMSYFNTKSKVSDVSTYDRVFHQDEGFDMKRRRDDRQHWKGMGLNINQEESSRAVPVLSSSEYGRRFSPALNQTARQCLAQGRIH
ncbi:hypothetical protein CRENBAI_008382 [Crenichthys baileyi]|uniref:Uncharacterized protein n=1 Tax=Crenichthys baileyi TaxID=28760 RepID=A0AAV9SJD4_9TELE